jgi:uncharacterized protein (TIGR02246 family)
MKTLEETVREIADREAIRDLQVQYSDCLSRKDLEGLLVLFADDAVFVMEGIEVNFASRGIAAIRRMHEKAFAETTPRHFVHNQIVNLIGTNRARGQCSVEVRNLRVTMEWLGIGYFEDEYVKPSDQWKFAARHHSFEGLDSKVYLRTFIP